jgi:hypothetical protein
VSQFNPVPTFTAHFPQNEASGCRDEEKRVIAVDGVCTVSERNEGPVPVPAHTPFAVPVDVSDAVFFPIVVPIPVPLPNFLLVISMVLPFMLNDLSIPYSLSITITVGCIVQGNSVIFKYHLPIHLHMLTCKL